MEWICRECASYNDGSDQRCAVCGASRPAEIRCVCPECKSSQRAIPGMRCEKCGRVFVEDDFEWRATDDTAGPNSVSAEEEYSADMGDVSSDSKKKVSERISRDPQDDSGEGSCGESRLEKKRPRAGAVVMIVLLCAAVAAAVFFGVGYFRSAKPDGRAGEKRGGIAGEKASVIAEHTSVTEGGSVIRTLENADGTVTEEYYNNDGKLVEAHNWKGSSETGHTVYEYNDNGDISIERSFDASSNPDAVVQYGYSDDGTLAGSSKTTYADGFSTGSEYYDSTGKLTTSSEYEYDGTKLKKITSRNAAGDITGYTAYEYNDAGYIINVGEYSPDDELMSYSELKYDGNNNLIRTDMFDKDGKLTGYYENTYNENNVRTGTIQYDADGKVISSDVVNEMEDAAAAR